MSLPLQLPFYESGFFSITIGKKQQSNHSPEFHIYLNSRCLHFPHHQRETKKKRQQWKKVLPVQKIFFKQKKVLSELLFTIICTNLAQKEKKNCNVLFAYRLLTLSTCCLFIIFFFSVLGISVYSILFKVSFFPFTVSQN